MISVIRNIQRYLQVPAIGLGSVVLVATIVLVSILIIIERQPLLERRNELKSNIIALQTRFDRTARRIRLAKRFDAMSDMLAKLDQRLNANAERSEIVSELAGLSAKAGARIIHGANSLGKSRDGIVPVMQELTIEGKYQSIRTFLEGLSTLKSLTLLRNLEISSSGNQGGLRAKLHLVSLERTGGRNGRR